MNDKKETRRAGHFGEEQRNGLDAGTLSTY